MSDLNFLLFGIYPYIVAAVFFIGCWVRYDREPYTWKADSSQLLDKKKFRVASNLFHIGIIFVISGHFIWFDLLGWDGYVNSSTPSQSTCEGRFKNLRYRYSVNVINSITIGTIDYFCF